MRQIVLDTETTGLEVADGHRIIEIGCVELIDRRPSGRTLHYYLNVDRDIDDGAYNVHGIDERMLDNKPRFGEIWNDLLDLIRDAELIIHNAPFDIGFLNSELSLLAQPAGVISDYCTVLDTLILARQMHPGLRNGLDALCKRYQIDNSHRQQHGALLDAGLLASVYLSMTGGQTTMALNSLANIRSRSSAASQSRARGKLLVIRANPREIQAHEEFLSAMEAKSQQGCLWRKLYD